MEEPIMRAARSLLSDPSTTPRASQRDTPQHGESTRDAAPFIAWVEQKIAFYNESEVRQARERGLAGRQQIGGLEHLLADIGWLEEGARKRMWRWRNGKPGTGAYVDRDTGALMVPADQLEAALEHAEVAVWELYDDEEADATLADAFCPVCSDEVTTADGVCPWCGTAVGRRPRTTARGGPPKHRRGRPRGRTEPRRHKRTTLVGLRPAPKPDPIELLKGEPPEPAGMSERRRGMTEPFVREAMRVYLEVNLSVLDAARVLFERYPGRWANPESMRCGLVYCFTKRGVLIKGDRRIVRHRSDLVAEERLLIEQYLKSRDPGYAYRGPLPPEVLWEAASRYYIDGYGFLRIARLLKARWRWVTQSSDRSFAGSLYNAFRVNAWPTRPQREATAAANYRHGMSVHRDKAAYNRHRKRKRKGTRPRCQAITETTGKQCGNFAMAGDTRCWAHSRQTTDSRRAALSAGRQSAQRELVDSGPFVSWLRGRVECYGSQHATVKIIGLGGGTLGRILKTGGTTRPGKVTRRLIERTLQSALQNDPDLVVPRFTDLYEAAEH
jgi:hypothetical protein